MRIKAGSEQNLNVSTLAQVRRNVSWGICIVAGCDVGPECCPSSNIILPHYDYTNTKNCSDRFLFICEHIQVGMHQQGRREGESELQASTTLIVFFEMLKRIGDVRAES
jgi:hypothetical protein